MATSYAAGIGSSFYHQTRGTKDALQGSDPSSKMVALVFEAGPHDRGFVDLGPLYKIAPDIRSEQTIQEVPFIHHAGFPRLKIQKIHIPYGRMKKIWDTYSKKDWFKKLNLSLAITEAKKAGVIIE